MRIIRWTATHIWINLDHLNIHHSLPLHSKLPTSGAEKTWWHPGGETALGLTTSQVIAPAQTCCPLLRVSRWRFPSHGGTKKWMAYTGKSYWNGWFGGTPISGNLHIICSIFCPTLWLCSSSNMNKSQQHDDPNSPCMPTPLWKNGAYIVAQVVLRQVHTFQLPRSRVTSVTRNIFFKASESSPLLVEYHCCFSK